jgi:septal ring factor EnvC (AmiA/AmiB activator)
MFAYYGDFGRARAARIASIRTQLERIIELDQALAAEEERLAQLENDARGQLETVQQGREDRASVVKEMDQQLKNRKSRLARLKREESTLEGLLTDLRRVLREFPVNSEAPFENSRTARLAGAEPPGGGFRPAAPRPDSSGMACCSLPSGAARSARSISDA